MYIYQNYQFFTSTDKTKKEFANKLKIYILIEQSFEFFFFLGHGGHSGLQDHWRQVDTGDPNASIRNHSCSEEEYASAFGRAVARQTLRFNNQALAIDPKIDHYDFDIGHDHHQFVTLG